jgi:hypothetical protein
MTNCPSSIRTKLFTQNAAGYFGGVFLAEFAGA